MLLQTIAVMEIKKSYLNGVNLKDLSDTINMVYAHPELATFRFRVNNQWIDGSYNQSVIQEFYGAGQEDRSRKVPFIADNDLPGALIGTDQAPSPSENFLHALAGCLTTTMVYHATANGYKLNNVRTHLEGDLNLKGFLGIDPGTRPGFREIRVFIELDGDLSDAEKEEIIQFGKAFSPVMDMITNRVPVRLEMRNRKITAEVV